MGDSISVTETLPSAAKEISRENSPVYTIAEMEREFRQAEIITNVAQYVYDPVANKVKETYRNFVVVASQDCDLLWDYNAVEKGEPEALNSILLFEADLASTGKSKIGSKEWNRTARNKDDRFHYLERVPENCDLASQGLPSLLIDFKRYFTITRIELQRQCASLHGARRRCRLQAPYREHLQSRLAFYLQRVMLPLDHMRDKDPGVTAGSMPETSEKAP